MKPKRSLDAKLYKKVGRVKSRQLSKEAKSVKKYEDDLIKTIKRLKDMELPADLKKEIDDMKIRKTKRIDQKID